MTAAKQGAPPSSPLIIAIILISAFLALALIFQIHQYPVWINEGGIIESLSALGYFLCASLMIFSGGAQFFKKYYYIVLLVILFGFRELDFDKKFTTAGILTSKLYSSNSVPLAEKLAGLFIVLLLIYILFMLLKNHSRTFFQGIKAKSPLQLGILSVVSVLVFAKAIDGLGRKLGSFGIVVDSRTSSIFEVIEEVLELGIPMLIIATLLIYRGYGKK